MTKKRILILSFALVATVGILSVKNIAVEASDANGSAGQGTGTIIITKPTDPGELLSFTTVPDFDFGSHSIMGSLIRLTSDNPVISNLSIKDFRDLDDEDGSTYHVTASVQDGENGFKGSAGSILTTANVAVTLGDSNDGTLKGVPVTDITDANTIAYGKQARGLQETSGGTASLDITNISGIGAVTADTYSATINYTLVAGI